MEIKMIICGFYQIVPQVRPTLDYLVNTAFSSGNFPSSKGRRFAVNEKLNTL